MDEKERLAKAEAEAAAAREAQAKAEAAAAEANAALAKFAEQQRQGRHAAHVQFAEAQMKAGVLTKPEADALPLSRLSALFERALKEPSSERRAAMLKTLQDVGAAVVTRPYAGRITVDDIGLLMDAVADWARGRKTGELQWHWHDAAQAVAALRTLDTKGYPEIALAMASLSPES